MDPTNGTCRRSSHRRGFVDLDSLLLGCTPPCSDPASSAADPPTSTKAYLGFSKRDLWAAGPDYPEFWKPSAPPNEIPKHDQTATAPKVSKNSIFDMPQAISKPALKMTLEELAELKAGRIPAPAPTSTSTSTSTPATATHDASTPARDSITIPVRRSVLADHPMPDAPPPLIHPPTPEDASKPSLATPATSHINTHHRRNSLLASPMMDHRPTSPAKSSYLSSGLPSPQSPNKHSLGTHDIPDMSQVVYDHDIQLFYFPIRKNFLGKGRYCNVFLGSYTTNPHIPSDGASRTTHSTALLQNDPEALPCAVKRYHATAESQAVGFAELFILRKLAAAHHPNLIRLIGAKNDVEPESSSGPPDAADAPLLHAPMPRLLVIMELCGGGTLYKYVSRHASKIGKRIWMKFARQLASAVDCIHRQGLIHHDIKPHNCLMTDVADLKLADFGNAAYLIDAAWGAAVQGRPESPLEAQISTNTHSATLSPEPVSPTRSVSSTGSSLIDGICRGTQPYSAPELFAGAGMYSFPVDIYSVGVTLFYIVSGADPFAGARTSMSLLMAIKKGFFESGLQQDIGPEGPLSWKFLNGEPVPQDITHIITSCVHKDPSQRPTAAELIARLEALDNYIPLMSGS
ncbi:hypothetical protein SeLEV6574_g07052 [Synchytrium endobioticum]|uniref:non-specific serine/threonine protein kinase n=1 Tax=Synchytrium endobioticum TaxID=286115 RepID=A0A507CF24_9FUNG|nr:hypothetical protein SeLEV6574_g07052 [Synchytrium endobioticum]